VAISPAASAIPRSNHFLMVRMADMERPERERQLPFSE
jgi:hypothetical protein